MATLTLHNFPDALHDTLKRLARTHRRSVDEEAVAVFEQALPKPPSREEEIADIIARTHAARARMKRFMTDEEIDAAVEEGRA
jgi:plasmid stability protein